MGKPEGMRPLGRPRRRRKDNINKWNGGIGWIDLAQNRDRWLVLVKAAMKLDPIK